VRFIGALARFFHAGSQGGDGPLGRRRVWLLALVFLGFLALFSAAAVAVDPARMAAQLARLSPQLIAGLLALSLLNYLLRLARWRLYARRLGLRQPLAQEALVYVASFSMTATPGKAGELLRVWLLKRRAGWPYTRSLPLFVADRLSDLLALLVLALSGLSWAVGAPAAMAATFAVVGGLLALFLRPAPLLAAVGWLYGRVRRAPRRFVQLRRTLRQGARLRDPRLWVAGLALGVLGWGAEAAGLWLVLDALGAPVAPLDAAAVFALALILGAVSMLPGGLGGTEAGMVALLSVLGVPLEIALTATLAVRLATLWFAVGLGLLALPAALRPVPAARAPA
jgi:uncharacterized protein (TIRG00374 family)